MNILRACADWRVVAVLVAVGAGVAVFAPNLIATAIPFLLVASCPLSMILMMRTMGDHGSNPSLGPGGSGDRPSDLRDRLAAARREQLQLEQELARLDDGDHAAAPDPRGPAPAVDAQARSR